MRCSSLRRLVTTVASRSVRFAPRPPMSTRSAVSYSSGTDYDDDNVFKKIIAGDIPSHKVFENEHVLALLDAFPSVEGHCLLISKLPKATIMDFTAEEAANYLSQIPKLCRLVQQTTGATGVTVLNSNGYDAGQRVFHVHYHVLPRFKDDGFTKLAPSKDMITTEAAKAYLDKMRPYLRSEL